MADISRLMISMPLITKAAMPTTDTIVLTTEIQSLPARFAQISRPIEINGIIISQPENGPIILQTAAGNFALKPLVPQEGLRNPLAELLTPLVQNQKSLTLVLQPGSPPQQALLNLPATAAPTTQAPTTATKTQPLAASQPISLAPGSVMKAVVLPQGVAEAFAPSGFKTEGSTPPSFLTAGTTKEAGGLATGLPASTSDTAGAGMFGVGLPSSGKLSQLVEFLKTPLSSGKTSETPPQEPATKAAQIHTEPLPQVSQTQGAASSRPGAPINLRLEAILPADSPPPTLSSLQQLVATVVGKGPEGQLLLSTGSESLFIRQSSKIPDGSKLIMTFLPPDPEADVLLPVRTDFDAPAMQRAMAALAQIEPALAQHVLQKHIPQPNDVLPSTLLLLFNAINEGGVQGWLGSIANGRFNKATKLELVAAMAEEMQKAGGLARDSSTGQWQTWPIPLYDGTHYQMLRLYVRRDRDRQSGSADYPVSSQTRFLINMNMSQLGAIQIDGLSMKKQLDLILRSEKTLPPHLPNELRALYVKNLEALGLAGSLTFQKGRANWIEIQKAEPALGVVT